MLSKMNEPRRNVFIFKIAESCPLLMLLEKKQKELEVNDFSLLKKNSYSSIILNQKKTRSSSFVHVYNVV